MDYTGLLPKFQVNRSLTDEERQLQLKQKTRLEVEPIYQAVVIRINGTFLETADKFYTWKGWLALGLSLVTAMIGGFLTVSTIDAWSSSHVADLLDWSDLQPIHGLAVFWIIGGPILLAMLWLLHQEAFRHTHYPLRFNRRTRMVHAFRYDGSVLSAKWDDLFFTLGRGNRHNLSQNWDVRMHVLEADRVTVKETLALGLFADDLDVCGSSGNFIAATWKMAQRQSPGSSKYSCQSMSAERPSCLASGDSGPTSLPHQPPTTSSPPLVPLFAVGRWFPMRTSKVPVWPEEIDAVCQIEPNDPYRRDARDNPADMFGPRT